MKRTLTDRKFRKSTKLAQGSPCIHGHSGLRYVAKDRKNGGCVECKKALAVGPYAKVYREAHRAKAVASNKAWYETHREEKAAYTAAYYQDHREEKAARSAARDKANPHKARAKCAKRHALKQMQRCTCCPDSAFEIFYDTDWIGKDVGLDTMEVDHIVPLRLGGPHCTKNLQVLPPGMHKDKTRVDHRRIAESRRFSRLLKSWAAPWGACA